MRLLALLLLISLSSFIQAEVSFTELGKATHNPERLKGTFQQEKYLAFLNTSLSSSGKFNYQKGVSIRWVTLLPIESEIEMTQSYIVNKQGQQELSRISMVNNPAAKIVSQVFFSVLTADWENLSKAFSIQGEFDAEGWHASLKPLNETIASLVISVEIHGDKYLRELTIHEARGNRTRIRFSDLDSMESIVPALNENSQ